MSILVRVITLCVITLSVITLSVVTLTAIMVNVVMSHYAVKPCVIFYVSEPHSAECCYVGFHSVGCHYAQCRWHRFDKKVLCDLNKNLKNLKFFLEQPSVRLEAATTTQNADSGY